MRIGINRTEAIGDILMLSGVILRLKEEGHKVFLSTKYSNIDWSDFLKIDFHSTDRESIKLMSEKYYDLDLCYEKKPTIPIWAAYSEEFFGTFSAMKPKLPNHEIFNSYPDKSVILHPSVSSLSRTLPLQTWQEVSDHLISKGYTPIVVGTKEDHKIKGASNTHGKPELLEIKNMIAEASLFVGMDSGIMHLAQATNTPIIGIFTIARPENRIWREENTYPIIPNCECQFCLEKTTAVNYIACPGDTCIPKLTSSVIIKKIDEVLR